MDETREALRQKAVAATGLLDTPPEREFDALARTAQRLLQTRMSSITLIDSERQWFKARCGPLAPETERAPALCTWVFENEAPMMVSDASRDPRFVASPFVTGEPHIRYYAGVPVRARQEDGEEVTVATLCVLHDEPRQDGAADLEILSDLAAIAENLIALRSAARREAEAADAQRVIVDQLRRERRQFRQAEQMADIGSWRLNIADNRIEWSEGVFAIHELPLGPVPALEQALEFYCEPDRSQLTTAVARTIETGEPFVAECDFVTSQNRRRRVRCWGEIELSKGKPVALIGVVQDMTERHRLEETLRCRARIDDLTGLANRAEFHRLLDESLKERAGVGEGPAVLLLDLDNFKGVNDALGHAAGDDVLRQVAAHLRDLGSEGYRAGRLGGDEFAILGQPAGGAAELDRMVERLLRKLQIVVDKGNWVSKVTATIGISWARPDMTRDALLHEADVALYEAKRARKGTARTFQGVRRLAG